jgi:hypothetical protein
VHTRYAKAHLLAYYTLFDPYHAAAINANRDFVRFFTSHYAPLATYTAILIAIKLHSSHMDSLFGLLRVQGFALRAYLTSRGGAAIGRKVSVIA